MEGRWGCAGIAGLVRGELLSWGGDQAANEAERRPQGFHAKAGSSPSSREWRGEDPGLSSPTWSHDLEAPYPCWVPFAWADPDAHPPDTAWRGARLSEPWTHLPSGVRPPDPVIGLLGPSGWNLGPPRKTPGGSARCLPFPH